MTLGRRKEWQEIVLVFTLILFSAFKQEQLSLSFSKHYLKPVCSQGKPCLCLRLGSLGAVGWMWSVVLEERIVSRETN